MEPFLARPGVTVYGADALAVLRSMPDACVHSIITDPPYGLSDLPPQRVADALAHWLAGDTDYLPGGARGFMGHRWDRFVPPPALWQECLRVLTPGGHLAAFAGARTVDLMGLSLRLGGFELRDMIGWASGGRMPKTTDLGRLIDKHLGVVASVEAARWAGWTAALKPALEPILLARKPLAGTVVDTVLTHGTGALNVGAVRVPFAGPGDEAETKTKNAHADFGTMSHGPVTVYGDYSTLGARPNYDPAGRLPSNLLLDHDQAAVLDAANPPTRSRRGSPRSGCAGDGWGSTRTGAEYEDAGGPSRFFHRFETTQDDLAMSAATWALRQLEELDSPLAYHPRAGARERPVVNGTAHPTPKPLALIRHLVRLLTPPGARTLDPFAGSGTTVEAAILEQVAVLAAENHQPYLPLIRLRVDRASAGTDRSDAA